MAFVLSDDYEARLVGLYAIDSTEIELAKIVILESTGTDSVKQRKAINWLIQAGLREDRADFVTRVAAHQLGMLDSLTDSHAGIFRGNRIVASGVKKPSLAQLEAERE